MLKNEAKVLRDEKSERQWVTEEEKNVIYLFIYRGWEDYFQADVLSDWILVMLPEDYNKKKVVGSSGGEVFP